MKLRIMGGRMAVAIGVLLVAAAGPAAGQDLKDLRTQAEASGFKEYTTYDNMMEYLQAVQSRSLEMRLSTYGATHSDRVLPYAIFSRPTVTQPWEAWTLGKPIVVFAAGVHGGERTLRESVLIMVRELATPGSEMNKLLDDLVILVVPQINPDGFSAEPNPTRGNLWGLDLNRDYMKLEQPEIAGYVQNVILRWAPHLFIDGHNGGSFPYNLNYQCGSHAAHDQRITLLCDKEIFPAIDRRLERETTSGLGTTPAATARSGASADPSRGSAATTAHSPTRSASSSNRPAASRWRPASRAACSATRPSRNGRRPMAARSSTPCTAPDARPSPWAKNPATAWRSQSSTRPRTTPVNYLIGEGQGEDRKIVEVTGARS
jgi:hypothetical protein